MAHKITVKISKNNYIQAYKKSKKVKRLRAYARALDTVNIVSTKHGHLSILTFFNALLKPERDFACFTLSGINSQILNSS